MVNEAKITIFALYKKKKKFISKPMHYPENNPEVSKTEEEAVVTPSAGESLDHPAITSESDNATDSGTADTLQTAGEISIEESPESFAESTSIPTPSEPGEVTAEASGEPEADHQIPTEPVSEIQDHHAEDEEEDEETKMMDEEDSINQDYSAYSKKQLLDLAMDAPKLLSPREAVKRIQNIRPFFDSILKQERQEQLQKYLEAGNEEEGFEIVDDGSRNKFYEAFKMAQEARSEERKRIEDEKLKNLAAKNAIIERIKALTESDETTDSINEVKELQNEWKTIRAVPKTNLQELYDRYHFYLDKFYDNYAINRELKDLDRQKNLTVKIELVKKVAALQDEPSLKRAFILLAKYQEEFKNTGPVPKEVSENVWSQFKSTVDSIYAQRKAQFDLIQEKRQENLQLKEVLVEKARYIANHTPSSASEWKSNLEALNKLMDEWKTIGQVPKAHNESIWHKFREQFGAYYKNRNEQFKKLNASRKANIAIREDICKRAEALKDGEDFNHATREMIKLQEEWKASGPLPEGDSQRLWKKFRAICDDFFKRKHEHFESRKSSEEENLAKKQGLIEQLKSLLEHGQADDVLGSLREIQNQWNEVGFVPIKQKKQIADQFHDLLDEVYRKFRKNKEHHKQAHLKDHYRQISVLPGGDKKLGDEERKIRDKMNALKAEITTLENNIEFFARSKNADKFRKEVEEKINKVNGQIEGLKKELAVIRSAKTEKV